MAVVHISKMYTLVDNSSSRKVTEDRESKWNRAVGRFKSRREHHCPCDTCWDERCLCNCYNCSLAHGNREEAIKIEKRERQRMSYLDSHRCPCNTCLSSEEEEDSEEEEECCKEVGPDWVEKLREMREKKKKLDGDAAAVISGGEKPKDDNSSGGEKPKDDNSSGEEKPKDDNDSGEKPSVDE